MEIGKRFSKRMLTFIKNKFNMEKYKKMRINKCIICGLLVVTFLLFLVGLGNALKILTYEANEFDEIEILEVAGSGDVDMFFRYDETDLGSCLAGLAVDPDVEQFDFSMTMLELDCGSYSFYHMIKFIRNNSGNIHFVLGKGLTETERASATLLAQFFQINNMKKDSDYLIPAQEIQKNMIIVGNSYSNELTYDLIGEWNNSKETLFQFIVNESFIKIIIAGTSSEDTIKMIDSLKNMVSYYESFTEDCVVVTGCEAVEVYSAADVNYDMDIDSREILEFVDKYYNEEADIKQVFRVIDRWSED